MVVNCRLWPSVAKSATALAIRGDRIATQGTDAEIRGLASPKTRVIDAAGGLAMPGFNDAHVHFRMGARSLRNLDLSEAGTSQEILRRIAAFARAHPERDWLVGRGWFYAAFPGGLPTRQLVDAVVPDRPVVLEAFDGHTTWVNTAALQRVGITRETPDPPRGEICRDSSGEATGVLKEAAMELADRAVPPPSPGEDLKALAEAMRLASAAGLTSVQEAEARIDEFAIYDALQSAANQSLRIRIALVVQPGHSVADLQNRLEEWESVAFPRRNDAWISAGILKAFADGVIESGTAAMLAPYEGIAASDPGALGAPQWEAGELDQFVRVADAHGWQVQIHAVGDAAVRTALDAYQSAAAVNGPRDRRHRIEHIETIDPADIPRFGRLGVVASMQPYHADPNPNQSEVWARKIGPERASRGWVWRSLIDAGATVAFGSDWPIMSFSPFLILNTAVNRTRPDGTPPGGWLPEQRLSVEQALHAYTQGSAFAEFSDARKGTLQPGVLADVVVLDADPFSLPIETIAQRRVSATIVGGRVTFET